MPPLRFLVLPPRVPHTHFHLTPRSRCAHGCARTLRGAGYGPTRWMWPTAAKYPRTYRPAGDIHIDPADLCFTGGTHGGTNGSPLHDFKDGHDITERPGVERGPVGPMNPPWAQSPTPPGSARMLSASDMGRAGFAASTRSSATRSPTGSPESPM